MGDPTLFLNISKNAGLAIKEAFKTSLKSYGFLKLCLKENSEKNEKKKFDFYVAHVGFDTANLIGTEVITLLRNPIDRI